MAGEINQPGFAVIQPHGTRRGGARADSDTVRMQELITAHYLASHSPCKAHAIKLLPACQDAVSTGTDELTLAAGTARRAERDERLFCLLLLQSDGEASLLSGANMVRWQLVHISFAKKIKRRQPREKICDVQGSGKYFHGGKSSAL